ncbi:PREDICTED: protein AF-9-like, partial [Fulmarus glacialis]|uniref:protein AF-9-like n=1 Tax=Fulmarus glacialis TaxID=30455 RepID=UPI00051BE326
MYVNHPGPTALNTGLTHPDWTSPPVEVEAGHVLLWSFIFQRTVAIPSTLWVKQWDPARILNTNSSSSSSNSFSKTHKLTKEHKEKTSKDSKEHKSAFKEPSREHNKSSKESSKKPKENKPLKDEKIVPKMAFKEPKPMSKEPKSETTPILTITGGQQQEKKTPTKRTSVLDSDEPSAKKRKKSGSDLLFKSFSSAPPLILTCSADKKQTKDRSQVKVGRVKIENDALEKKTPTLPPFDDIVDPNDSDMEENTSSKSE